ncbi:MAG TPA: LacI family DNA-binding transcriptional regulator [Calidithermus sp.]|nr:LacI family DNA-binding transcriptional regulator [Calidithermus sp.]
MTTLSDDHPTLREVARRARVSIKTASRVANREPNVAPATRRRVERVIARLGYRPNSLARGMRTRRSDLLGLVVPSIRNPFYPAIARGVEDAARVFGRAVCVLSADRDPEREQACIAVLVDRRVDGIILGSPVVGPAALRPARRAGIPIVAMNPDVELPGVVTLRIDNAAAARAMTEYLLGLGHRRIGFLDGIPDLLRCRERLAGYRAALEAAGVAFDPEAVERGDFTYEAAYHATAKLLARQPMLTAVFAGNDLMAIGAVAAALDLGRRVPDDLSVVGFDDIDLAAVVRPALTTIHQPNYEMGALAAELILRAEGRRRPASQIMATRLVVRQSAGPPARAGGAPALEAATAIEH